MIVTRLLVQHVVLLPAYRVSLFPGLIDQFLDLGDVASKIVLQLSDWLQLLQQPVSLILQVFHFSPCSVDCVE